MAAEHGSPAAPIHIIPTAIVTGGARGIGSAFVAALLSRGWRIGILDKEGAEDAARSHHDRSDRVVGVACDVGDPLSFRTAFDAVISRWGALDLFVNNAGMVSTMFADSAAQVNVNLLGTIRGTEMAIKFATAGLTRRADPPLLIVCTASSNGLVPADSDLAPVYVATKFGIVGLVRSLRPLASRFGVRVNAICPVTVDTPMVTPYLSDEMVAFLDREGRGGIMPPSTCADALLRLIDDPSLAGDVLTVHPTGSHVIPLDAASPALAQLGLWQETQSADVAGLVSSGLKAAGEGTLPAWSGI